MAKPKVNKGLPATVLSGSDEMFDFFCQPCSTEKQVEAAGYCQQCRLYLCAACVNHHGKLPPTKHHKVLDKASMPKTKPPTQLEICDDLTETCKDHPGKILEYFCKVHGTICCSVCLTLEHSSCSDKNYIPDISGGFANSQACNNRKAQLDRLIKKLSKQVAKVNEDVQKNGGCRSNALAEIKEFRKHVNELIDEIEEDARKQVNKLYQDNNVLLKNTSQKCQSLLSEVKSMATDIERNSYAGKHNQVFVDFQLSSQRIEDLQKQVNESGLCTKNQFEFKLGEKLQQMKSTLSALWSLSVREGDTPTKARFVRDISVKSGDDTEECLISGIVALAGGRVLVSDYSNKTVTLIDTALNKFISRMSVPSKPFDITEVDPTRIAVALGDKQKIEIINVSETLSSFRTIQTPKAKISGLLYDGSNFIAACQQPGSVQIIDMSGSTLSTFATDSHGQQLFNAPRNIALGCGKDVVYVTDKDTNTVTCLTCLGQVIWVYTHDKLRLPRGLAVGRDGSVYVCSSDNHTVHNINANGRLAGILLSQKRGLASLPAALTYDEEGDMLYISSFSSTPESCNFIKLYQLE